MYETTGSELQMGIVLAISMLPAALFGMVAGALVDRFDRRRTMVVADIVRAALVLSVPFVAPFSLVGVYVIALAVATMSLFFEPAKLSLIPELVPDEQLMAANSLDNATVSTAELVGLALAAGVVVSLGWRSAFFFDAATYAASALLVWSIRHRERRQLSAVTHATRLSAEVLDGLRYIAEHVVLRDLLSVYAVAMMGVAASVTFVYILALERFAAGATGLAVLDGAITVGLLLGSLAVGRARGTAPTRTILAGLLAFGVLLALAAVLPSVAWAVPVFVAMGMANMFFYVPMTTLLQTATEPAMRGRALAAKQTMTRILSVVGFLGAGALAEAIDLTPSIFLCAALVIAAALGGWSRPHLRVAEA